MKNVVVPNVTLKVLSTLLKVVMIEGNGYSQPIDISLFLAVGHMKVA